MTNALVQFNGMGLLEQAQLLAGSNLVPKQYRGKPADTAVALIWGAEVGIGPTAALNYLDVIDGNPSVNADGCNALIRRAGHSLWFEMSPTRCVAHGKRGDTGDEMVVEWTIEMAKTAGLAGKAVWKSYASDMLKSRATTQIARALFADVLMGVKYAPEEVASFATPDVDYDYDGNQVSQLAPPPTTAKRITAGELAAVDHPPVVDTRSAQVAMAAVNKADSARRSFAPPTSAQNTDKLMAELGDGDEMKKLYLSYKALNQGQLAAISPAWMEAELPMFRSPKTPMSAEQIAMVRDLIAKAPTHPDEEPF